MKFTSFEIMESYDDIGPVLENQGDISEDLIAAVDKFVNLESLQGDVADSLKQYLMDVHGTLIKGFTTVATDLNTRLAYTLQDYKDIVDCRRSSVIITDHVTTMSGEMATIAKAYESSKNKIEAELSEVSDIFTPSLSASYNNERLGELFPSLTSEMDKVVTDAETFEEAHKAECDNALKLLEQLNTIMTLAQDVLVGNVISYDPDSEAMANAIAEANDGIVTILDSFTDQVFPDGNLLQTMSNVMGYYSVVELASEVGFTVSELRYLSSLGLHLKTVYDFKSKTWVIKIAGENAREVLEGLNISHLTNSKLNKLLGDGLSVTRKGNKCFMEVLAESKGFSTVGKSFTKNTKLGKLSDLPEGKFGKVLKGAGKVLNIAGYVMTGATDTYDNLYNDRTGRWEFSAATVSDSITDSAIDIGGDLALSKACLAVGACFPPVGVVVGVVAAVGLPILANTLEFGEPPKTIKDMAKDGISDLTHWVGDKLSKLFW